ncbi:FG-GAP-like repeat-containing protein [Nonomuraea sp. NPDC050478]|uniref:FG-GAP-like repeat-containing protein n=1 Tax=Nonomuraea sp. NPDC050478 TaxID=3364365 RepID=UPI00379FD7D9
MFRSLMFRAGITGTAVITGLAISTNPALADPTPPITAAAYQLAPCDPRGTTARDASLATQLNSTLNAKMRGYMSAYRVSCARMIIKAVRDRGLDLRAAAIAMTTVIVESSIQNISEKVDHTSLGLFQQLDSWGSAEQRLDPTWATNAFLNKMLRLYPNNSWRTAPIGEVCQAVQVSAYPERYPQQAGDGQIIANTIWPYAGGGGTEGPAMMRDDGDGSMTIYRWTSSGSAFGRASDYTSGGWTMANTGDRVASGDVDGDGKDDVVAAYQNSDGTFSFHVWKNGVSYAGKWYTSGPYALGPVGGRLVVADLTGDGRAEPAMMRDDGDGSMTIYRWTSTGSAFSRATDYTSGGWTMANVGDRVASGDVDGDGKDDVVAAYQNSDGTFSYHVWKNGLSYAGKWYTSGPYALGPVDGRLVVADLTGDGKAEPAMMRDDGDGSMTIYRWTSSGSAFSRASDYTSGGWTMSNVGNRVASGDVDGDGKDDIVATYQNSDGTFSYHVWKNGVSYAGKWYTSGPYALGPVDGRLVLGNW